ncbi:hypothetical protein MAHJHV45_48450 [Mycobacterium avium subsp. hominissuis]
MAPAGFTTLPGTEEPMASGYPGYPGMPGSVVKPAGANGETCVLVGADQVAGTDIGPIVPATWSAPTSTHVSPLAPTSARSCRRATGLR